MNTVDLIENDFKSLQTEFKKKFTQIKEVNNSHFLNIAIASRQSTKGHPSQ